MQMYLVTSLCNFLSFPPPASSLIFYPIVYLAKTKLNSVKTIIKLSIYKVSTHQLLP